YNSENTRRDLQSLFQAKFGKPAYSWQLDVAEAMLVGLDTVLIAGTGAGKTIPFMLPLLMDKQKKVLVVSPLKVLQNDQVRSVPLCSLHSKLTDHQILQNIMDGTYQALFMGPEMCLEHAEFRKAVQTISKDIVAIIVDESHCISQWGGEFHPHYAQLERLHTLVPDGTSVLAASTTLNPQALDDVYNKLVIDKNTCFHLNLSNDGQNISTSVHSMKGSNDLPALKDHLNLSVGTLVEIPKTLIFMNSVKLTQHSCQFIQEKYPSHWHQYIDYIHAYRSQQDKRKVMRKFREGKIRILMAMEAAGMVCNRVIYHFLC
ncbi:P-loop containing nucleoside triphosphate hydrolase protein, partial [Armillaria gallica]